MYGIEVVVLFTLNKLKEEHMGTEKLARNVDFFLTIDLVRRAAVKIGMSPMEPRLSLTDCAVDKTGVTFASGTVEKEF